MTNTDAVKSAATQLRSVAERICEIIDGIAATQIEDPDLADTYEHFLIDEATHVQVLALELTRLLTDESGESDGGEE